VRLFEGHAPQQLRRESLANYLLPNNKLFPVPEDFGFTKKNNYECDRIIRDLLRIILVYNCRICELLSAKYADVITGDRIIIYGAKHSRDYILYLPNISIYKEGLIGQALQTNIWQVAYKTAYLQIKRAYNFPAVGGRKNCSVYHIGRYLVCAEIERAGLKVNYQDILRHNSAKSQLSYINKKEIGNG
jgi:integrase